jgi:hypothetical protein
MRRLGGTCGDLAQVVAAANRADGWSVARLGQYDTDEAFGDRVCFR